MAWSKYIELTGKEIEDKAGQTLIAVVPIGSVEQHGPHLPVGTDYFITETVLQRAVEITEDNAHFLLLPVLPFSCSIEHAAYPGTITLSPINTLRVFEDIGKSLRNSGINNVVLASGHGGNEHLMETAAREMKTHGMNAYCIQLYMMLSRLGADEEDVHAGEIETGIILELNEKLVRKSKIDKGMAASKENWKKIVNYSCTASQAWVTSDVAVDGVIGDPSAASRDEGSKWLEKLVLSTADALNQIAASVCK